ncbi:hypothetical protein P9112_002473 [Eukaryota sp. TZLM1-RC]
MSNSDDEEELFFEEEEAPETVDELMAVSFRNVASLGDNSNLTDVLTYLHVFEGRDLHGRSKGGCGDPIVRATLTTPRGTTTEYTSKIPKSANPVWDRTLFFPLKLSLSDIDESSLLVEVLDASSLFRDLLIGSFEFSLTRVRAEPNHAYIGRWVALANSEIAPGAQGFLRLSTAVVLPGESLPADDDLSNTDDDLTTSTKLSDAIIRPPGMEVVPYKLNIRLFKGRQFPKLDRFGTCDPYMNVVFSGQKAMSSVQNQTLSPLWNEVISLPVVTPTMSDTITLSFHNKNIAGDMAVGNLEFSFTSLVTSALPPKWYHLYNQKTGHYMGSVYLALEAEGCTMEEVEGGIEVSKIKAAPEVEQTQYSCLVTLCEVAEFPDRYTLKANFGGEIRKISSLKTDNGFGKPYVMLDEIIQTLPIDRTQLSDLVLWVNKKGFRDSEWGVVRIPASDLIADEMDYDDWYPKWYSLTGDNGGSMLIKAIIVPSATLNINQIPKPEPYPVYWYSFNINVIRAEDLLPMDSNGLSDPYVNVKCGPYSDKTFTVHKTLNPCWFQSFSVDIPLNIPPVPLPKLSFELKDWNAFESDEDLGYAVMDVQELFGKASTWHWLPLRFNQDGPELGKLLVSVEIQQLKTPPMNPSRSRSQIKCDLIEKVIEIEAVGLRDLDITRASFMEFRFPKLECLQSNDITKVDDSHYHVIQTPKAKTPTPFNPNILRTFVLNVKVPSIPEWCPSIDVRVFKEKKLKFNKMSKKVKGKLIGTSCISLTASVNQAPIKSDQIEPVVEDLDSDEEHVVQKKDYLVYVEDETLPETTNQIAVSLSKPSNQSISTNLTLGSTIYITTPRDSSSKSLPPVPTSGLSFNIDTFDDVAGDVLEGRKQLVSELEETDFLNETPFDFWDLKSGKAAKRFFKLFSASYAKCGCFKGKVRVFDSEIEVLNNDLKELYAPKKLKCRVYYLDASKLVPKNSSGYSDPYPVIKLGPNSTKAMDKVQKKTNDPEFYYATEIDVNLPGDSELHLSVYDKNAIFSDSLIGSTIIDLEFRSLSREYKELSENGKLPVEKRTLWSPCSAVAQGVLRCWIELITPEESRTNPLPLFSPPPCIEGELRVVLWGTKKVPFGKGDMIDLYTTSRLTGSARILKSVGKEALQRSDTHWRATSGNCNFNWRFTYPLTARVGDAVRLNMQVWDTRLIRPNDYLAEVNLDLRPLINAVGKSSDSLYLGRQMVPMRHPLYKGQRGKVDIEVHLLTKREAQMKPAGKGRSEPNENPVLPAPEREGWAPWRLDKYAKYYLRRLGNKFRWIFIVVLGLIALRILFWIISWFR